MKLITIILKNYRCFVDFKLDLNPGLNVIAGINGCGKTSLLMAIRDVITGYTTFANFPAKQYHAFQTSDDVHESVINIKGKLRFERQFPASIATNAEIPDSKAGFSWSIHKTDEGKAPKFTGTLPRPDALKSLNYYSIDEGRPRLPIFAFYRANRNWSMPTNDIIKIAQAKESRSTGYANWENASTDSDNFQHWVIGRCLERLQTMSEEGTTSDISINDELSYVNAALRNAVENFKGLRYDFKRKSILVDWSQGRTSVFENLSDGQRSAICLIADISRRMCTLNPQLEERATELTPGIILIDELDIHLHPKWQRILINGIKAAFPSVQIIATSHSPQILGELKPEEIFLLRPDGVKHPRVSYGLTSSQVLEEIMEGDERAEPVKTKVADVFDALAKNEIAIAEGLIRQLEENAPGIPEIASANAVLRRKEILGR